MRRSLFDLRSHQSGSDIRLQALACFIFIEPFNAALHRKPTVDAEDLTGNKG